MSRVRYRERQRLRTVDLQDEQDYLLGLDGRHNVGPHDWGIVRGLQILIDEATGVATLFPGIAIDGYGRELVVAEAVPLDLAPNVPAHYVYLFYCERPRGQCGERPNTRVNDSVAIAVAEDPLQLPDEPDAALARAAGSLPDEPFWPVLLGVVNTGNPRVDVSEVRYTRIHAGPIRHSTGRTAMRVGQESLIDPYHFLVTCGSENGATQNRMAIDRDGNLQFWNDVIVESASKFIVIASPIAGVKIKSQLKPGVGSDIKVRISKVTSGSNEVFQILFRGKTPDGKLISEPLFIKTNLRSVPTLNKELLNFSNSSQLVNLSKTGQKLSIQSASTSALPQALSLASTSAVRRTLVADDAPARAEFGAGTIKFEQEQKVGQREFCGCADPDEKAGRLPEGLVFQAGPNPPAVPAKDIYCLRISKPNVPVVDNLRIVGGLLKQGDLNQRLVVGDTNNSSGSLNVFRPWLAFRGNGALKLFGGDPVVPQLSVQGVLELGPIKPDPRDPVFNALSVLAFVNGVLSLGTQLLKLTITDFPAFIETEQPWGYKLTIKNETNEDLTAVSGNSETISDGKTPFLRFISGITPLGPGATSSPLQVQHTPDNIRLDPTSTEVSIEVAIAMRGKVTIGGSRKIKIPVILSPDIDLSGIPVTVVLASPAEEFPIKVKNRSTQAMSITNVVSSGAAIVNLPVLPIHLGPNTDLDLDVTLIPDVSPPLTRVSITFDYKWDGDPKGNTNTLERHKDIDVS